ncbi:MAG: TetR/AcrR family transcriptional regulator [Polyangiaceae bacterium]|nr:TetR/AcrR family transcriptional regulator [Polyangiaceae bacterium]
MPPANKGETLTEQRRRPRSSEPPARKRRDAEEAREAILDVAERHLVEAGPAGIRLQEVAADAGVSHPTVLHHFGSREALVKAVTARALQAIHRDLVGAIAASNGEVEQLSAMLEAVYRALHKGGHGRVMLWLALSGDSIDEVDANLRGVVDATHALRRERCADKGIVPTRDDTAHLIVLAALALVGSTVMGPTLLQKTGLKDDEAGGVRFRKWLSKLLVEHLEQRAV